MIIKVISVSYGTNEASVTLAYATRQCNEYAKIGMLGSTVLYSSGDDGVAGNGGECLSTTSQSPASLLIRMLKSCYRQGVR